MKISLSAAGKRYQRHWIFRDVNLSVSSAQSLAILGHNGSGKSTLMRIIAGMQPASEGKVIYEQDGKNIEQSQWFQLIAVCAPGIELPEELTIKEFISFHLQFKKALPGITPEAFLTLTGLVAAADKPLADLSSGMKQRVKLAQAIFCDTPVLLLDEPCTNLDEAGVAQYHQWIKDYTANRIVIVASNDEREYGFCKEQVRL